MDQNQITQADIEQLLGQKELLIRTLQKQLAEAHQKIQQLVDESIERDQENNNGS